MNFLHQSTPHLRSILKNFNSQALSELPEDIKPSSVDIWFQDETRVGRQGSITRRWAEKGTRPRAVRRRQFISSCIFGAVCPARGEAVGLVLPHADTEAMKLHIREISEQVPEGRHALVIADRAAWHSSKKLNRHNVTLLRLPPYSPELNPVEQVRQWLKRKFLSNRAYRNYEAIIDACCEAWNCFADGADRITQMCSRKRASITDHDLM